VELSTRFDTAGKLSDEDRKVIIDIARHALAPFQSEPQAKADLKSTPEGGPREKS
jgi:F-type H+-transporting ATPase subunit alpha